MSSVLRATAIAMGMLAWAASTNADPITVVAPPNAATVEGNTDNGFPFNTGASDIANIRYQQVVGASVFSSVHPMPLLLTGLSFRPDINVGNPFSTTLRNIEISLSTTRAGVDRLNPEFAENVGADARVVHSGPLTLSSSDEGPAAGPKQFDIHIPFTNPFLYDPRQGSLLLDVTNLFPDRTTQFDAADDPTDQTSRMWSFTTLSVGESDSLGLVARFAAQPVEPAPVPEPGSMLLLLTGGALIGRRLVTRAGWRERQPGHLSGLVRHDESA
jgi:hypothetical protein